MADKPQPDVSDAVERQLPPDMALLFAALRAEMHARDETLYNKLLSRILIMGIPLGAVGGLVGEVIRPGTAEQVSHAVLRLFV